MPASFRSIFSFLKILFKTLFPVAHHFAGIGKMIIDFSPQITLNSMPASFRSIFSFLKILLKTLFPVAHHFAGVGKPIMLFI